ncbi:unnamed protein product [Paramecium sonneborni]|uniref:Uncharacterized protein n=1 Tax=Paramecium sonneborni TaxID=65129 RepID=A0A8S1MGZ9_9CILI|nr:unnamed protein product [Paramecium sonneborni]
MKNQLRQIFLNENESYKKETQSFEDDIDIQLEIRRIYKIEQNNSIKYQYIHYFNNCGEQEYQNIKQKGIIINLTQFYNHAVITSDFQIFKYSQQNYNNLEEKIIYKNNQLRQKGQNSQLYIQGDKVFIQFKQILWQLSKKLEAQTYLEKLDREFHNFKKQVQDFNLEDYQTQLSRTKNPKFWIKNIIQRPNFQNSMIIIQKNSTISKFFVFIHQIEDQDNKITYFCHNENNLYRTKYAERFKLQLDQKQIFSLNQLQQQMNGFIQALSEKKQKIFKKTFIGMGFDLANQFCYLFAKIEKEQPLKERIQTQDFAQLSLKNQKKMVDSLSLINFFRQQFFLKEDYFNEEVYQFDSKGKLKINISKSFLLIKSNGKAQNDNPQQKTKNDNPQQKTDQLIQVIEYIIQINLIKNLDEEEQENLLKLKELVEYYRQETLSIQQLISVLDEIQFKSKKSKR